MACVTCPYLQNYTLLWKEPSDGGRLCVMLWCCAGPELQIRDGDAVLVDEYFDDPDALRRRAETLRAEYLRGLVV